jgi:aquaporin NIP
MNKRLNAEFIGTFALVFAGTGAVMVNSATGGAISHVGVALTFGLVIMIMIYAIGDVSGCHINPAVTLGFWAARRFPADMVWRYIAAQLCGAVIAALLWRVLLPGFSGLGVTHPSALTQVPGTVRELFGSGASGMNVSPLMLSFIAEIIMTFFLVFVILSVSTGAKEKGITAGLAIGFTIAVDALFGGPISGASMNPARSIGPALVNWDFKDLWIYILAPLIGSALAVWACHCVREDCRNVPQP